MVLRNSETVEKLTVDQKLELAASLRALSSDWAKRAGLPSFRRVFLGDGEEETAFPSAGILAHSWNAALMGEVFGTLAKDKVGDAPALCYMPSLRLRAHPCGDGVSEDPFLLSSYALPAYCPIRRERPCSILNTSRAHGTIIFSRRSPLFRGTMSRYRCRAAVKRKTVRTLPRQKRSFSPVRHRAGPCFAKVPKGSPPACRKDISSRLKRCANCAPLIKNIGACVKRKRAMKRRLRILRQPAARGLL